MTRNDYAAYRKTFSVAGSGRRARTTENTEHILWAAWDDITQIKRIADLTPADYYTLHERSGIGLDAIWPIVNAWAQQGMYGRSKTCNVRSLGDTPKGDQ